MLWDDHNHHYHNHGHQKQDHEQDHHHGHGQDNNLRAAYLHVLADALTSVLAIVALLLGRAYGWFWADPVMGIIGAIVISRWSWGLIKDSAGVLLDRLPDGGKIEKKCVRQSRRTRIKSPTCIPGRSVPAITQSLYRLPHRYPRRFLSTKRS